MKKSKNEEESTQMYDQQCHLSVDEMIEILTFVESEFNRYEHKFLSAFKNSRDGDNSTEEGSSDKRQSKKRLLPEVDDEINLPLSKRNDMLNKMEENIHPLRLTNKKQPSTIIPIDQVTDHFISIWKIITELYWNDICSVNNNGEFVGLYMIHFPGATLTPLSIITAEFSSIDQNSHEFEQSLKMKGSCVEDFNYYVTWLNRLEKKEIIQFPTEITWNQCIYVRHANINKYKLKTIAEDVYTQYVEACPAFSVHGECYNKACKMLHDPNTISVCKNTLTYYSKCFHKTCMQTHKINRNQYNVPFCQNFLKDHCRYNNDLTTHRLDTGVCMFVHSTTSNFRSLICRRFAYIGFCPRGKFCKFNHVFDCPNIRSSGICIKIDCSLSHKYNSSIPDPVKLSSIEDAAYLQPNLTQPTSSIYNDPTYYGEYARLKRDSQQETDSGTLTSQEQAERVRPLTIEQRICIPDQRISPTSLAYNRKNKKGNSDLDPMNRDFIRL